MPLGQPDFELFLFPKGEEWWWRVDKTGGGCVITSKRGYPIVEQASLYGLCALKALGDSGGRAA